MDQIKEQLAGVMKFGFWILCGVTAIGALGISYWSASALIAERDAQTAALESDVQKIQTISSSISTHPNDETSEQMEVLVEELKEDVLTSWTRQYERQKKVLVWPVEELREDFVNVFSKFEPIEEALEYPVPAEKQVAPGLLNRYRDYIGGVLPDIAEIAGAKWTADFNKAPGSMGSYGGGGAEAGGYGAEPGGYGGGMEGYGGGMEGYGGGMAGYGGGMAGMGAAPVEDPPLVKWSTSSQEALMANLFPWRPNTPSMLEILYSQENLWVLTQLMQVIDTVNGDARQPFQAAIREINEIAIGKSATQPAAAGGMGGMGDMYGGGGYGADYMAEGGEGGGAGYGGGGYGAGGAGAAVEKPDPADMRYVDINYEPIEAATLRSAMASSDPKDAYMAVAKRIPVKLNVKMDQRKIPLLIAECGNAALMIEVRQVRVNPTSRGTMGMGMGMGMGGGMPGGPGMSPMGAGGGEMAMPGGMGGMSDMMGDSGGGYGGGYGGGEAGGYTSGSSANQGEFPSDVPVEVYGVVYIFNPPNMEKLGIEKVDENTEVEGDIGTSVAEETENPAIPQPDSPEATGEAPTPDADAAPAAPGPATQPPAPDPATRPVAPGPATPPVTPPNVGPGPGPAGSPPGSVPPGEPAAGGGPAAAGGGGNGNGGGNPAPVAPGPATPPEGADAGAGPPSVGGGAPANGGQ